MLSRLLPSGPDERASQAERYRPVTSCACSGYGRCHCGPRARAPPRPRSSPREPASTISSPGPFLVTYRTRSSFPCPWRITPLTAFRLSWPAALAPPHWPRRTGPPHWPAALARRTGPRHDGWMGIAPDAVASYVDRAVEAMADIVGDLGDDLANTRPGLPGANSPYAILRHCLGVMEFWGGQVVAGRTVDRDREAEFRASGPVDGLIADAQKAQRRFRADIVTAEPKARPRGAHPGMGPDELELTSQGHVLLHVMEEVCLHLGQMEITRDLLRQP